MSALAAIQSGFTDYILDGAPAIAGAVLGQQGVAAEERLAIYYRAYRIRMREALCETFDKTWTYAGDELFDGLAESYIAAHPSRFRNLRWYGDQFAAHAAQSLPDYPFVAELAAMEWTLGLAFDAPDAPSLGTEQLRDTAPEEWDGMQFGLHPSVGFLKVEWNTVAIWQALHDGSEPPSPEALDAPREWLVWRTMDQPHFRSLDALEARTLRSLGQGVSFGNVCAEADQDDDDVTLRMAGYLQNWLAHGLLTAPLALPCARI
jgi:hypothetical protein